MMYSTDTALEYPDKADTAQEPDPSLEANLWFLPDLSDAEADRRVSAALLGSSFVLIEPIRSNIYLDR